MHRSLKNALYCEAFKYSFWNTIYEDVLIPAQRQALQAARVSYRLYQIICQRNKPEKQFNLSNDSIP